MRVTADGLRGRFRAWLSRIIWSFMSGGCILIPDNESIPRSLSNVRLCGLGEHKVVNGRGKSLISFLRKYSLLLGAKRNILTCFHQAPN
ncbi:hypothetical protein P154DRAFT_151324 [Amniculicola lignicola CBS 123094]|uniref:Uncharacterized protein n=1 Tax=Amniculicola lignicola CBS 123094 TaxID=1392246 RepID=A0A6A5WJP3_9PLEO|nr:hypothetical protein P154DRAFT_151324 [Amniculicola lignicola CBS 123094]